ncbi:MAG: riboflavin biosynthesis protein RibF [Clostridia bacterium]|nr:riboflavin biosynthesis protein RibF [Clostridia bacterium]
METIKYEYGKKPKLSPSVLALGFFDGVTLAHRELLKEARIIADKKGLSLGVFTFYSTDPIKPLSERIYSTEDKLLLLGRCGVDFVILSSFDELSGLSPEEFVRIISEDLGASVAVSGFNFRFGKGARGNVADLKSLMKKGGGSAVTVKEQTLDGKSISATLIRELISLDKIEEANRLLGAPYMLRGLVSSGKGLGHSLGFPTVNTDIPSGRATPLGVYRSAVPIGDRIYHAVTNIGSCPTMGERKTHAETHIIDYDGDLYSKDIEVYLLGYLRDEIRFNTPEELIAQVEEDKKRAIKENGELTCQKLGLK